MFPVQRNVDAYCFLKHALEPEYQVECVPDAGYFQQTLYRYRILDGDHLLFEFSGDFRDCPEGGLAERARDIVRALRPKQTSAAPLPTPEIPIASRLPPKRQPATWFSSGRGAFAFLLTQTAIPQRIWLPALVCWSLVDVLTLRYPQIDIRYYPIHLRPQGAGQPIRLEAEFPTSLSQDEAVLIIHFFGHRTEIPSFSGRPLVLEDRSHCLDYDSDGESPEVSQQGRHLIFGSLRKSYRVSAGGFVLGTFNPLYEPDRNLASWLSLQAADWRELREAENMLDRSWSISDIPSQALAGVLRTDREQTRQVRRTHFQLLAENMDAGTAVVTLDQQDCPLLHCRLLDSMAERDDLRGFLQRRNVFTSVHWPLHSHVRGQAEEHDICGAQQMARQSLAFPVSDEFSTGQIEAICDAVSEWKRAGGSPPARRAG